MKKSAYMPHAKNVIKIDCVYGFHLNCRFTFSMKLPRHFVPRKDSISGLSIVRWDISLTLNMTYFFYTSFWTIVKNPTGWAKSIYFTESHPPGRLRRYCYSALNACALKLSFSAFFYQKCKCLMNIIVR